MRETQGTKKEKQGKKEGAKIKRREREKRERSIFFQPMESGRFCISLSLSLLLSFSFSSSSSEEETTETHRFFSPHRPSLDARFSLSLTQTFLSSSRGEKNIFTRTKGERETRERENKKRKQISVLSLPWRKRTVFSRTTSFWRQLCWAGSNPKRIRCRPFLFIDVRVCFYYVRVFMK